MFWLIAIAIYILWKTQSDEQEPKNVEIQLENNILVVWPAQARNILKKKITSYKDNDARSNWFNSVPRPWQRGRTTPYMK